MRWFKHVSPILIAVLAASVPLHAGPIVWQLIGVSFSDGAHASGTFSYDAVSDNYSAWNIAVTSGILSAYTYRPGVDSGFVGIHPAGQVDFVAFPPNLWPICASGVCQPVDGRRGNRPFAHRPVRI
jgi:hypothetical protein